MYPKGHNCYRSRTIYGLHQAAKLTYLWKLPFLISQHPLISHNTILLSEELNSYQQGKRNVLTFQVSGYFRKRSLEECLIQGHILLIVAPGELWEIFWEEKSISFFTMWTPFLIRQTDYYINTFLPFMCWTIRHRPGTKSKYNISSKYSSYMNVCYIPSTHLIFTRE